MQPDVSVMDPTFSEENEFLHNYTKQYNVNDHSALENLFFAMEGSDINDFLKDQLENEDFSIEEVIDLLRFKMIYLSEAHLKYRTVFCDTKNENKSKIYFAWFDIECRETKRLLHKKRKAYQAALKHSSNQVNNLKSAYFQQLRVYKKLKKCKRHIFLENKKGNSGI